MTAAGPRPLPSRRGLAVPPTKEPRPRFDEDCEWDANGWERVPTWERRP